MRVFGWSLIFEFLLSCSGDMEEKRSYYQNGNIYLIEQIDRERHIVHNKFYYENGNLQSEGDNLLGKDNVENYFVGYWKEYYPDGKIKTACTYKEGTDVSSRETGIYSGYKIDVHMGSRIDIDSVWYCPVRFFVDGISPSHYRVSVMSKDNCFYEMKEYPKTVKKYVVETGDGNCKDTLYMDETMYDYLMPYDFFSLFPRYADKDDVGFIRFAIHFPDTTCRYQDSLYQSFDYYYKIRYPQE